MEYCWSQLLKVSFVNVQAAQRLKITAAELCKLQVADEVIPVMDLILLFIYIVAQSILLSVGPPNIP